MDRYLYDALPSARSQIFFATLPGLPRLWSMYANILIMCATAAVAALTCAMQIAVPMAMIYLVDQLHLFGWTFAASL